MHRKCGFCELHVDGCTRKSEYRPTDVCEKGTAFTCVRVLYAARENDQYPANETNAQEWERSSDG
ncbi:hypothetical protein ZHAS_00016790 [Anopheles sinensis]|uniref:Uncharacterized protein n=1 Tax=Anopheles sinensis TaxID=74873 RepID=A0A084WEY6_ANOSI|nr:hypothetical protein ZHAS_00016790 [Anopheles sinensis]